MREKGSEDVLDSKYEPSYSKMGLDASLYALSLYSIDTHFDVSTIDSFLKHCGKRRNCSLQAISPSPTMFSTLYSIRYFYPHLSIFLTLYLYLLQNWKSPKLAYEVKCYIKKFLTLHDRSIKYI